MPTPLRTLLDELTRGRLVDLAWSLGLVVVAILIAALLTRAVQRVLRAWAARTDTPVDNIVIQKLDRPLRWLWPFVCVRSVLPITSFADSVRGPIEHACLLGLIVSVGWAAAAVVAITEAVVNERFDVDVADNLRAREVHTQVRGFRNVARFAIGLLTVGVALMTFDGVRQLGVSLLASAGVAGIVIGFAAQRSIATVFAGLQIALTQPIRVDDVVIVEGEWGRIEQVTLSYVVVRIWDLRRLVVPVTHFIEHPFENWTRTSADLLGTVYLRVDYRLPVEAVRAELERVLRATDMWDGKVCNLVVTEAGERSIELRALMSAGDSSTLWDLRCHVREQLLSFLQREHPDALPRVRAELESGTAQPTRSHPWRDDGEG